MFKSGQEIGLYSLVKRIGRGAFGEVWLAERRSKFVTTKVAVKLPLDDQVDHEAIRSEATLWEQASGHPNVLPIIDADEYDGQIVIVSAYTPDGSLSEYLDREGDLPVRTAVEFLIGILNGLEFLHSKKIIHRDLKPANILLQGNTPRLADFGISRVMKTHSATADMSGTPSYMAPEAFNRKRTPQTDIWSVGVIAYQMLNGALPFPHGNLTDLFGAIMQDEPDPLPDTIPAKLQHIVSKALSKDPEKRYQTAQNMGDELADVLVGMSQQHLAVTFADDQISSAVRAKTPVAAPPNNLTVSHVPIIGREKEIAEIRDLLRAENIRLITMTGIGGTGKTTLARAAVSELLSEFADGVFFVELATITNLELVAPAIAHPIGVKETGAKPVIELLSDHLRDKQILLVLDNFEQVTDAAPQIAELLAASPKLKILITSRVALHLSAEREYVVPPLSIPADSSQFSLDELLDYEAIKLFVERAQRSKNGFVLTDENAHSVIEICKRLDGLPLAIELAAARVKILTPQAILTKLENRLKLLTGGARDLPARQQTMRGSLEWSDELLTDEERLFFRHLSVFAGGFTVEAAEEVCTNPLPDKSVKRKSSTNLSHLLPADFDVLDGVTSLVDKSLLVANEQSDGNSRFRMLEVVREYALEFFEAANEANIVRKSHADHFLALAEKAEPHLSIAPSVEWLNHLEEEHDNLRSALQWTLEHDTEIAARLTAALRYFWSRHNHLIEARKWFELVLENGGLETPASLLFKLLNGNGVFAKQQGDYETARKMYEIGLADGRAANDGPQIAISSRGLGMVAIEQGDFKTARKFLEEGLAISQMLNDKFQTAVSHSMLGDLARLEGKHSDARLHFEASMDISRQLNDKWFVTSNVNNLGFVAFDEGDLGSARSHFTEALSMVQEFGNKIMTSYTIDGFCALAVEDGEVEQAAQLAGAAENLRASMASEIEPAERIFRDSYLAKLKAKMDISAFDLSYEQGRKMKLEEAVALCLAKKD